jgi:hypothetical protein
LPAHLDPECPGFVGAHVVPGVSHGKHMLSGQLPQLIKPATPKPVHRGR